MQSGMDAGIRALERCGGSVVEGGGEGKRSRTEIEGGLEMSEDQTSGSGSPACPALSPAARRALAEAAERRAAQEAAAQEPGAKAMAKELQGPQGLEPTRYGDWERKGIASDF